MSIHLNEIQKSVISTSSTDPSNTPISQNSKVTTVPVACAKIGKNTKKKQRKKLIKQNLTAQNIDRDNVQVIFTISPNKNTNSSTLETKKRKEQDQKTKKDKTKNDSLSGKKSVDNAKAREIFEQQYYQQVMSKYALLHDTRRITLFCEAVKLNKPKIITDMWNIAKTTLAGSPKDANGLSAIQYAAKLGNLEILKLLCTLDPTLDFKKLCERNNTSQDPQTLVPLAIESGQLALVEYLVEKVPTAFKKEDVSHAVALQNIQIAWFLATKGPGYKLGELLFLCIKTNETAKFKVLLESNSKLKDPIDLNSMRDKEGRTLLGSAVQHRRIKIVELLVPKALEAAPNLKNSNPNVRNVAIDVIDSLGCTPLQLAAKNGDTKIMEWLLNRLQERNELKTAINRINVSLKETEFTKKEFDKYNKHRVKLIFDFGTPLLVAANYLQLDIAELLLKFHADPNLKLINNFNPITLGLMIKNSEAAYFFLQQGVKPDEHDLSALLTMAITQQKWHIVEDLFKKYSDKLAINYVTPYTVTSPLIAAVQCQSEWVIDSLLKLKADVNFLVNNDNINTSSLSFQNTFMDKFIENTAERQCGKEHEVTALHAAAASGNVKITKQLISAGGNLSSTAALETTPFHLAVAHGKEEMITFLINMGADINKARNSDGKTPLFLAAQHKKPGVVRQLLAFKADPMTMSKAGETPLRVALRLKHTECAAILIEHGIKHKIKFADEDIIDLLCLASIHNKPSIIRELLKIKPYRNFLNTIGSLGWTPINLAIYHNHPNIIAIMLNYSIDWSAADKNGYTPFHVAVEMNHLSLVQNILNKVQLQDRKKLLNQKISPTGMTALSLATRHAFLPMVEYLLSQGADIETTNKKGATPLFIAVNEGHYEVAELLLQKGAIKQISAIPCRGGQETNSQSKFPISVVALSHNTANFMLLLGKYRASFTEGEHGLIAFNQIRDLMAHKLHPTPPSIHFIWVGGKIPKLQYLITLLKTLALSKRNKIEVNLWVENSHNLYRAIFGQSIEFSKDLYEGIKIRDVTELAPGLLSDPFYLTAFRKGLTKARYFQAYMIREMSGLKNLAAAADVYRLEILRQFGGTYLDIDSVLCTQPQEVFKPTLMREGYSLHKSSSRVVLEDGLKVDPHMFNNDLIASIPHHPILSEAIDGIFRRFDHLDHSEDISESYIPSKPAMIYAKNLMDRKRSHTNGSTPLLLQNEDTNSASLMHGIDRKGLTVKTSSSPLLEASKLHCKKESLLVSDEFPYIPRRFNNFINGLEDANVMGVRVSTRMDHNWLKNKKNKLFHSFDDSELYTPSIRRLMKRVK